MTLEDEFVPNVIINSDVGFTNEGQNVWIYINNTSKSWKKITSSDLSRGVHRFLLQADELKAIFEDVFNVDICEMQQEIHDLRASLNSLKYNME